MTTKRELELPNRLTTVRLGMGTVLRQIASHTTLLPAGNRDAQALAYNLRNREALSRFLDYTAKARPVIELRKRPSRRTRNIGKYLWLEDGAKVDAPFTEHNVISGEDPTLVERLASRAAGGPANPLLLNIERVTCTEPKALQQFMDQHDPKIGTVKGRLWLWTERFPCNACQKVICDFLSKQPEVVLSIVYQYAYSWPEDNLAANEMRVRHGRQLRLTALKHSARIKQRRRRKHVGIHGRRPKLKLSFVRVAPKSVVLNRRIALRFSKVGKPVFRPWKRHPWR